MGVIDLLKESRGGDARARPGRAVDRGRVHPGGPPRCHRRLWLLSVQPGRRAAARLAGLRPRYRDAEDLGEARAGRGWPRLNSSTRCRPLRSGQRLGADQRSSSLLRPQKEEIDGRARLRHDRDRRRAGARVAGGLPGGSRPGDGDRRVRDLPWGGAQVERSGERTWTSPSASKQDSKPRRRGGTERCRDSTSALSPSAMNATPTTPARTIAIIIHRGSRPTCALATRLSENSQVAGCTTSNRPDFASGMGRHPATTPTDKLGISHIGRRAFHFPTPSPYQRSSAGSSC